MSDPAISATGSRYHSPLRERQVQQTRALILASLAEEIVERGAADVSVRDVAARSEIAERTVYRYFPDRQALLDGLAVWVATEITARGVDEQQIESVSDLTDAAIGTFAALDELGPVAEAMVMVALATGRRSASHERRSAEMRRVLEPHLSGLGDDAEATFGVIRHLLSALTWYVLRTEFGLSGEEAGRAVAGVVEAVLAPTQD